MNIKQFSVWAVLGFLSGVIALYICFAFVSAWAVETPPPPEKDVQNQGQQQQQGQQQGNTVTTLVDPSFSTIDGNNTAQGFSHSSIDRVLATGTTGGVKSESANHSANHNANTAKVAPYHSFNTSISEVSHNPRDILMTQLIHSECKDSVSGAHDTDKNVFFGLAFTIRNKDCEAIRNARVVWVWWDDKPWAVEILCGRKSFKEADARRDAPVCTANGGKVNQIKPEKAAAPGNVEQQAFNVTTER